MSKSTISTFKLFELFPDNEAARLYLEARLWPNGTICPDCRWGATTHKISNCKRVGFYHCNACNFDFTIRTGTIFERSKIPLNKWLYAMYLLVTARKGISSLQLAKEIGVTQKTAWFMLGRLREACSAPDSIDYCVYANGHVDKTAFLEAVKVMPGSDIPEDARGELGLEDVEYIRFRPMSPTDFAGATGLLGASCKQTRVGIPSRR